MSASFAAAPAWSAARPGRDKVWRLSLDGYVIANPDTTHTEQIAPKDGQPRSRWRDSWPQESHASVERALARARSGHPARFRTFESAPDGARLYWETVIVPIPGRPDELLAFSRDATEETETSALMASIVNSSPSPLMVKSMRDERLVLCNPAAETTFGLDCDDASNCASQGRWSVELARLLTPCPDAQLKGGEIQVVEAVQIPARFGGGGVFDVRSYLTYDDQGERHLVMMATDVAQRLHHERELAAALVQAEQADAAKARFLANMSHEMRTPLNGVVACADMLARLDLPPAAREMVSIIHAAGDSLRKLFVDLLQVARGGPDQGEPTHTPFLLGPLVKSVVAGFSAMASSRGVRLTLDSSGADTASVVGDQARLARTLSILLENALKFTEAGSVTLTVTPLKEDRFRFAVRDTGLGFTDAERDRILERFGQADDSITRRFGGLGLGLAIVHDLLGSMGGRLDCHGRPGEGAEFWFELVLPSRDPTLEERPPPSVQKPRLHVLSVDDHEVNRRIIKLMLDEHATVSSAHNGLEAVEAYRRERPDLVLMDMQMPVMDGLEAVREIRRYELSRAAPRCPIIMITANVGAENSRLAAASGADLLLEKPLTAAALFESIHKVRDAELTSATTPAA